MGGSTVDTPIGLSAPFVDEDEEQAVLEVIRSGRLAFGAMIERFEHAPAERVGAPHFAALSSGTAGLHLSVKLAGVPRRRGRHHASKPYLPALHLQLAYRDRFGFSPGMFPVAEAAGDRGLALPFHTGLSESAQERVAAALTRALRTASRG